ncbi:MAG: hypothetical protein JO110_14490 [Acetobacteraceae bacterium]|nr:hypothetical protein [Acetobacteraceae bacterium]
MRFASDDNKDEDTQITGKRDHFFCDLSSLSQIGAREPGDVFAVKR